MKKILLLIFVLISFSSVAQRTSFMFNVPSDTVRFKQVLTKGQLIYDTTSKKTYQLSYVSTALSTLATVVKTELNKIDSTKYATKYFTGITYKLKADSIDSTGYATNHKLMTQQALNLKKSDTLTFVATANDLSVKQLLNVKYTDTSALIPTKAYDIKIYKQITDSSLSSGYSTNHNLGTKQLLNLKYIDTSSLIPTKAYLTKNYEGKLFSKTGKTIYPVDSTTKVLIGGNKASDTSTYALKVKGNVNFTGDLTYNYMHAVGSADSVVGYNLTGTQNIYYKINPSVFVWRETDGITGQGDSATIITAGDYTIWCWLNITSAQANNELRIKLYINNVAAQTSIGRFIILSKGTGLSNTLSFMWYKIGMSAGDRISVRVAILTATKVISVFDFKLFIEKKPE